MAPTLYMLPPSAPVRAVLMTAKAISLQLDQKEVDLLKGQQLSPEYLKLNPQHTIPTFVDDDGFVICDSHAIMAYIVSKYAKDDSLYPKDLKKRAVVDQRMHFETGVMFPGVGRIFKPIMFDGKTTIDQVDVDHLHEIYAYLESFLQRSKWMAGDSVTIADYSLMSSISTICPVVPIDSTKFPKLLNWFKRVEGLPEYEANKNGLIMFSKILNEKLGKK